MKALRFRAYALATAVSRRPGINPETGKAENMATEHEVEEIAVEGKLDKNGQATVDLPDCSMIAFYGDDEDGNEVCLGRILGPIGAGSATLDFADVPAAEPPPTEIVVGGVTYKKAD
jgi:hypothetical protein